MPENRPLLRMLLSSIRKPDMFLKWEKKKKVQLQGRLKLFPALLKANTAASSLVVTRSLLFLTEGTHSG